MFGDLVTDILGQDWFADSGEDVRYLLPKRREVRAEVANLVNLLKSINTSLMLVHKVLGIFTSEVLRCGAARGIHQDGRDPEAYECYARQSPGQLMLAAEGT